MSDYGKRWESSRGICPDCGFDDPSKGHKCPAGPVKKVPTAEYQRGYAEGVKAERAAIVRWPRSFSAFFHTPHTAAGFAAQLSSGVHVTPREAEEGKGA